MLGWLSIPIFFIAIITMVVRVLIVDHSFIANLKAYIQKNIDTHINFSLCLDPKDVLIQYAGRRSRTLLTSRQQQLEAIQNFKPRIVIMQLGSNDLCNRHMTVELFTSEYKSIIMELSSKYNVQRVVELQILLRLELSCLFDIMSILSGSTPVWMLLMSP